MPTSATPAYRIMPFDKKRNFRSVFRSQTPARPEATTEESRAFQRSRARIIGPGSCALHPAFLLRTCLLAPHSCYLLTHSGFESPPYDLADDPTPASTRSEWVHEESQRSSVFKSEQPARPSTAALVNLHGRLLQDNSKDATDVELVSTSSEALNRSVYGVAPGSPGSTFSRSKRFDSNSDKQQDLGHSKWYDSGDASGIGTVSRSLRQTPRLYASPFHPGLPARPAMKSSGSTGSLGPGSYRWDRRDVACGGILRAQENFRPSANMHPRVGGKFAHLGLDWW